MRRARALSPSAQTTNERYEAIAAARDVMRSWLESMQQMNLASAIAGGIAPAGTVLPAPVMNRPSTTRLGQRYYAVSFPYKLHYVDANGIVASLRNSATLYVRDGQVQQDTGSAYSGPAFGTFGAFGAFGQDDPETVAETESANPLLLLQSYAPTVQALTDAATDPVRQAAVLRAKLQDAISRGASARQIQLLQAQLAAAERRVALKQEAEGSVRQYRMLGQLGIVAGIVLLGSLTYLVLRKAK